MKYKCVKCGKEHEVNMYCCGDKFCEVASVNDHVNIDPKLAINIDRIPYIHTLVERIEKVVVDMATKNSKTPMLDKLQIRDECKVWRPTMTDAQVVERFNELVKEGKIVCENRYSSREHLSCRLRPAKKYRPFTAVEAANHIGRIVRFGELNGSSFEGPFMVGKEYIQVGDGPCKCVAYDVAIREVTFFDTGEPFGVLVKED